MQAHQPRTSPGDARAGAHSSAEATLTLTGALYWCRIARRVEPRHPIEWIAVGESDPRAINQFGTIFFPTVEFPVLTILV